MFVLTSEDVMQIKSAFLRQAAQFPSEVAKSVNRNLSSMLQEHQQQSRIQQVVLEILRKFRM